MTSSELSDALNPYASHPRSRQAPQTCLDSCQQNVVNIQNYTPHRSELELAIPESQIPLVDLPQPQIIPTPIQRTPAQTRSVHELLRTLQVAREAHERETQRRVAWEQEQEVKYRQRQIELEQQISEMQRQITVLQTALAQNASTSHSGSPNIPLNAGGISPDCSPSVNNSNPATGLFTPQYSISPVVSPSRLQQQNQAMSPISLMHPNPPSYNASHFLQNSSAAHMPVMTQPYYPPGVDDYHVQQAAIQIHHHSPRLQQPQTQQFHDTQNHTVSIQQNYQQQAPAAPFQQPVVTLHAPQSVNSSPSPLIGSTDISHSPRSPSSSHSPRIGPRSSKKRTNADISASDYGSNSDSSDSNPRHRIRRVSHHDRRCLTVHHAMRAHFLRMMQIETDKELPDSHVEGEHLNPDDPIRFVWDKTTKQSVHNSRMKTRIMDDIKENTRLYRYVPKKDFMKKKVLEAVFEQCFVTFRQKFRAQRDALTAQNMKKREGTKARRARRVSRRKLKLSNRAESREKIEALEHVIFDGALQLECMSSEESDYETDASGNRSSILRTRGYAWRSQKLVRFFSILDNGAPSKLKRGVGKKERQVGSLKEGFRLPPKGIASWMVSKQWMKLAQQDHPDLPSMLRKLIEEPAGSEWGHLDILGESGEDESEIQPSPPSRSQPQADASHSHPHPHQSPQQHHPSGFHVSQTTVLNYGSQPNMSIPQQHYNTTISSLDYALS